METWQDGYRVCQKIYPDDPAKVDYPFFLLGRWLKGREKLKVECEEPARIIFSR